MKIVALIMLILIVAIVGTLAVIYVTVYSEVSRQNRKMLEMYAELYTEGGTLESLRAEKAEESEQTGVPEEKSSAEPDGSPEMMGKSSAKPARSPGRKQESEVKTTPKEVSDFESGKPLEKAKATHRFRVSTFYSVAFSDDGSVIEVSHNSASQLSDEELAAFAEGLKNRKKQFGTERNIVYLVTSEETYTLVTMMDNTVLGESMDSLVQYMIIFGCISVIVLFFLSLSFSKWIIQPLEVGYQKQKQFISDAGHELKTPVSIIEANTELLLRKIGHNQWLTNIQYENSRMSELVHQLLEMAKLERVSAAHEKVNLGRIVLSGILPFEGIAFEQGVHLEYDVDDNVNISGNSRQLGELVDVLIDNALQYSTFGGKIRVLLYTGHNYAVFSVSNQGDEIPVQERDKIFERFYQIDNVRTENSPPHYGLGLSIAKTIVTAHHGKISAYCEEGVTTFKVLFPLKMKDR